MKARYSNFMKIQFLLVATHDLPDRLAHHATEISDKFCESLKYRMEVDINLYKETYSSRNENTAEIFLTFMMSKMDINTVFLEKLATVGTELGVAEWGVEESTMEDVFLAVVDKSSDQS